MYLSKYIVQVIIFLVIEITAVLTMIGTSYALGLVGPNGFSFYGSNIKITNSISNIY